MRYLVTVMALVGLAACATPTPFEPADSAGYGFADQRIEKNRYRVSFRGNSLTTKEQVETALLLRAAQVTLENGYDHFVIVSDDTETETRTRVTNLGPRYGFYPYYGFGAFPYYAVGYPWGPGFNDDVTIRESQRYTAVAYIVMGFGAKPQDNLAAYDAREVQKNLEAAVFRRPE